jgi:hypothetical protein
MRSPEQRLEDPDSGVAPNKKLRCHHKLCDGHQIFWLINFHSNPQNEYFGILLSWITSGGEEKEGRKEGREGN